jgi:hypothetical protein
MENAVDHFTNLGSKGDVDFYEDGYFWTQIKIMRMIMIASI